MSTSFSFVNTAEFHFLHPAYFKIFYFFSSNILSGVSVPARSTVLWHRSAGPSHSIQQPCVCCFSTPGGVTTAFFLLENQYSCT